MYSAKIMQHFVNPKNAGSIKKPDVTGKFIDEKNGSVVKIYLKINPNSYIIEESKFKALGSPVAIACSDLACDMIKGKHINEVENIIPDEIVDKVGIENIPQEKFYSVLTIQQAIKEAIKSFRKKIIFSE